MFFESKLGRVDVSFPTTSQTLESQRCHGFKNYPQCTSSTPPVILKPFLLRLSSICLSLRK
ncbi:MAG: hypothetical protein R3B45_03670 [Bdellovibrionota bacterium]